MPDPGLTHVRTSWSYFDVPLGTGTGADPLESRRPHLTGFHQNDPGLYVRFTAKPVRTYFPPALILRSLFVSRTIF
jgi:hypothetical protein